MERRDRSIVEDFATHTSTALLVTTPSGRSLWRNPAVDQLLPGTMPARILHVAPGSGPADVELDDDGGPPRWVRVTCHLVRPDSGGDDRLLYEVVDVTDTRTLQQDLRDREHRLARLEALAGVGTWEWDVVTNAVRWSPELLSSFGYPPTMQLDYATYRSLLHPDDIPMIEQTLEKALATGENFSYTHRMFLADRTTMRVFECHGEVTTDGDGLPVRVLGTAHDITEERRVQERLAFLAEHDPLTGLRNRRSVTTSLDALFGDPARRDAALLLIDIDHFKDINDLRGHAVGDKVMRSVAGALRTHTSRDAILGRLGGDEFAVVVPNEQPDSALATADALRASIARHPIVGTSPALQITASIGIALADQAQHRDELLANADLALYEAKRSGRNRVQMFAPEHYRDAAARVSEVQRVRDALDAGNLTLYAQPIVDLSDLTVVSHEVLVRLDDGLAPPVGPADFLTALEHTDVVVRMDRWVIDQAIAALASGPGRATALQLAVNVSSRSLEDPTLAEHIVDALHRAGVEPPRLGLEITETAAITNRDAASQLVTRLSAVGCRIALDDFGAGFGSFASLKHVPYSSVKIAGEFVRHADGPHADSVIIDAVVRLAQGLGVRTVAEQVDRSPLPEVLSGLGVDLAQGYHLGRPRPLVDLLAGVSTAV